MSESNIKRLSNKEEITQGTEATNLNGADLLLTQHTTGDNKDYSVPINLVQAIPVGETETASGTATKVVTLLNYPSGYNFVVGSKILITFKNANTATTQLYFTIGTLTKPVTVKGFALKSAIPAGSQIEFTYTGTSFNCQDFAISTIDTSTTQPVNSSAVNGALTDYVKSNGDYKSGDETDLNKYLKSGFYRIGGISNYTNIPSEATSYSQLIVSRNGDTVSQIFLNWNNNKVFHRCCGVSAIGSSIWTKLTTETDLNSTLSDYRKITKITTSPNKEVVKITYNDNRQYCCKIIVDWNNQNYSEYCVLFDKITKIAGQDLTIVTGENTITISGMGLYNKVYIQELNYARTYTVEQIALS